MGDGRRDDVTGLPMRLAPWEESLADLDARLATALGPMVRVLDDMIARLDTSSGDTGEPDGFDGTTNRGDFGRLLVDEWLLADEVPDEFLRRAAEKELTFLRRAHLRSAPRGRVIAVVDTGPDQLGAGRLVQLAVLVVLHRRARANGSELHLRLVPSGRQLSGDLVGILPEWLRARSTEVPQPDQLEAAFRDVDEDDHVWLLVGRTARACRPMHRRTVSSWITGWRAEGATQVTVRIGDATSRLELPDGRAAVAALRGEGLLRRTTEPSISRVATTGRGAVFTSADARLMWRGASADEIYGCFVGGKDRTRIKRYRMNGTVVGAASLGRRIVAAVTDGHALWIEVVGKKLGRTDRIHVRLADVGLDDRALADLQARPLLPLVLQGSGIVLQTPDGWFRLEADTAEALETILAMGAGHALDAPREAYRITDGLLVGRHRWAVAGLAAGPVFGPGDQGSWAAWSEDSRTWRICSGADIVATIAVEEGDRVHGLVLVGHEPALVVVSPSGRIVRQVGARHIKTWTRWAGPAHFDVHTQRPWLVRTTIDRITVGDLATGNTLVDFQVDE